MESAEGQGSNTHCCLLTNRCQVDDVAISQVESPVLIGRSEDLNEVTRLGVTKGIGKVRVIRGHLERDGVGERKRESFCILSKVTTDPTTAA